MLPFITPLVSVHKEQRSRSKLTYPSVPLNWPLLEVSQMAPVRSFHLIVRNWPSLRVHQEESESVPVWAMPGAALLPWVCKTSHCFLSRQQMQRLVSLKFVSQSGEEGNGGREQAYQNALLEQKWFLKHMVLPRERWWQPPPISGTAPRVVRGRIHMTHSYTQFHSVLCLLLVRISGTMDLYIFVSEFDSQLVV